MKVAFVNAEPCCVFHWHWIYKHAFDQVKAASDCVDYDEYCTCSCTTRGRCRDITAMAMPI